jgi:hypothetical protein
MTGETSAEWVDCQVCGRPILLCQEADGRYALPDAEAFRRDHARCLRRTNLVKPTAASSGRKGWRLVPGRPAG